MLSRVPLTTLVIGSLVVQLVALAFVAVSLNQRLSELESIHSDIVTLSNQVRPTATTPPFAVPTTDQYLSRFDAVDRSLASLDNDVGNLRSSVDKIQSAVTPPVFETTNGELANQLDGLAQTMSGLDTDIRSVQRSLQSVCLAVHIFC